MTRVTEADLRATLLDLADQIERGGLKSVTMRYTLSGAEQEREYTFILETAKERLAAMLAIQTMLSQVRRC